MVHRCTHRRVFGCKGWFLNVARAIETVDMSTHQALLASSKLTMDFRSQLSALSSKNGGGSGRSPNRGNNSNNNNNYYGRGDANNQRSHHHERRRPRGWNNQPPASRRRYHSPDRDGLGDLRKFGYRIPHRCADRGEANTAHRETPIKKTRHLALLGTFNNSMRDTCV